jgi:protoporphyrinogen oxidase
MYDLVIIGGGPAGLALAHCCSYVNDLKILIIEKEKELGGCHRVKRMDYKTEKIFTEHGPRIYSSTYLNFKTLLNEMETSFSNLFIPYNFQISNVGGETILSTINFKESLSIIYDFIKLLFDDNYGKDINMKSYMSNNDFSEKSIDMIDRICRLSDGGNINNFSLNVFLQIINQQFIYTLYQPKLPTDIGLFSIWKTFLEKRNVDFLVNTEIQNLNYENNIITSCGINNKNIKGKQFIIAVPPKNLVNILEKSKESLIRNSFGNLNVLKEWSHDTEYIEYISITFHWDTKLKLPKVYGFPKSDWGVAFIVLTDYMSFNETSSKTLISAAVTIVDKISKNNGQTANQCSNKNVVIEEVFKQLKESYPNLPNPKTALMSPNNFYEKEWKSTDCAFIAAYNTKYIPFRSETFSNLYNLGTHNGKSKYKFTTMESAVSNGMYLSSTLYPILKSKYKLQSSMTVRDYIFYFIIVIIYITVLIFLKNVL